MSSNAAKYPLGTVTLYGPNDKQATKLVASILPAAHVQPSAVRKWVSRSNDIREDPSVQSELTEFLKQNSVAHAVVSEQVVGCPHEPGVDFPLGSTCPICVFWSHHRRRPTHTKPSETGRNDPCPCGSGKKLKKCCGA